MNKETAIKIFEEKQVRSIWNAEQEMVNVVSKKINENEKKVFKPITRNSRVH